MRLILPGTTPRTVERVTTPPPTPLTVPDDFDPLADLLDVLDLRDIGGAAHDPADPAGAPAHAYREAEGDVFVGRSQPQPHGRVYGGQVIAQSVVAAGRTVASLDGPPRHLHSLHCYFLRAGDAAAPIRFAVERLRDGASFSARRVHAIQYGKPILSLAASFQTDAGGIDHAVTMPAVPDPETLRSAVDDLADVGHGRPEATFAARTRPVDIRHCQGSLYATPRRQLNAEQSVWIRALGAIPDDPLLHAAVLAYASDFTLLEGALRRHGLVWADPRLRAASLDHAMWFHRPGRADEWVLYTQASPSAQGGRGLGLGHMFAEDGTLLATVAQEGMLRLKE